MQHLQEMNYLHVIASKDNEIKRLNDELKLYRYMLSEYRKKCEIKQEIESLNYDTFKLVLSNPQSTFKECLLERELIFK